MNKKGMSGIAIVLLLILGFIAISALSAVGTYNGLVAKDVTVENKWGNIQASYERRLDLIPNLVATVKGSAAFEKDTQTQVTALRSGIQDAKTPGELEKYGASVNKLVSGIIINVEAYPELKSTEGFLALQSQLEGTENRINWDRDEYNTAVKNYKESVRRFPSNVIANMFNFNVEKWNMFEAEVSAENPPTVNFE